MINNRNDWTTYLNGFNNAHAGYNRDLRCWILTASRFAVEGIKREGYFTVAALGDDRYYVKRTKKAHQG